MQTLRLLPATFSCLLIAAHFHRAGITYIAILCLLLPVLLLVNRHWSIRTMQLLLVSFALEWLRTLFNLVHIRMDYDMPWLRLAIILGIVTIFTITSAFSLRTPASVTDDSR